MTRTLAVAIALVALVLFAVAQLMANAYHPHTPAGHTPTQLAPARYEGVAYLCTDDGACVLAETQPYRTELASR